MELQLDEYKIRQMTTSGNVFLNGKKYYEEGRVGDLLFIEDDFEKAVTANVNGSEQNRYKVKITISGSGGIKACSCNCKAFETWTGACKHISAALFKLMNSTDVNKLSNNSERRYLLAEQLFNDFRKAAYEDIDHDEIFFINEKIKLTPKLIIDSERNCSLSFTIGRNKNYILRNIDQFIKAMKNSEEYSYGKDLAFVHKKGNLDEESVKLYEFILNERDYFEQVMSGYSYYGYDVSRNIILFKRGIDDFFEMYKGKRIGAEIKFSDCKELFISEEHPPIKFEFTPDARDYKLKTSFYNILFLKGAVRNYCVLNGIVYPVTFEYYNTVKSIFECTDKTEDGAVRFSRESIQGFMTLILPKLKKYNLLENNIDELCGEFSYTPVKTKLYFDVYQNDVLCKAVFCYGETEINALDSSKDGIFRDVLAEYRIRRILKGYFFTEDYNQGCFRLTDEEKIYEFYAVGLGHLKDVCQIYATDEFENNSVLPYRKSSKVGITLKGSLLELSFDMPGYDLTELSEIIKSFKNRKRYHRLRDGSFISLENDNFSDVANILDGLNISENNFKNEKILIPKYNALYLEELLDNNISMTIEKDKYYQKIIDEFNNFKNSDFNIPKNLRKILRDYQKTGYKWLKMLSKLQFGGILADDMGLGKTLQIITLLVSEKGKGKSLIVCPNSLVYNWQSEIQKFGNILTTVIVAGPAVKRKELLKEENGEDVYITTYDMLKRDLEFYEDKNFRFLVADEAQNIKNPLTQNARSIKSIKSDTRFALTGTPIENSLIELWSLFDFIMPGYLYGSSKFKKIYESPIIKENDKEKSARLKKQISPFIMRRIKKDVLKELPDKVEMTIYSDMTEEQEKLYAAYLMEARGDLAMILDDNTFEASRFKILSYLTRLRQICCHPEMFLEDYTGGSGKLELTIDMLLSSIESGHRVLLFSQFTSMLAIIMAKLKNQKIDYFYLDGKTGSEARLNMANRFNQGEKSAFLISLKAGGTGLNLTGADIVIHYDPWWNPAVMDQASDRAHRIGQKRMIQVINMIAKDTIEEKIVELQQKKKCLIDDVISEGGTLMNRMTKEEILALFSE